MNALNQEQKSRLADLSVMGLLSRQPVDESLCRLGLVLSIGAIMVKIKSARG